MSRLLFNSGVLQFQGSTVQVIDAADTAADCTCCGGGGCSLCPDNPGGPYNSASYSVTVGGFPASFQWAVSANFICRPPGSPTPAAIRRYTITGLNAANGTYVASTDPSTCLIVPNVTDFAVTVLEEQFTGGYSAPCSFTGLVSSVSISKTWRLTVSSGFSFGITDLTGFNITQNPGCFPALFTFIGNACANSSGSTIVSGGACTGTFTFTGASTVTLL